MLAKIVWPPLALILAGRQRDLITVVGHAAMISAGEFVQASGFWINDRTHGVQFKASFLKAAAPTTVVCCGVGERSPTVSPPAGGISTRRYRLTH